ncbi:MAG: cupin domain-containing protein [Opitutales bacterium]
MINRRNFIGLSLPILGASFKTFAEETPKSAGTSGPPDDIEVIPIDKQTWYEAEDKAVAREFASPRNSRAKFTSTADILIPGGVTIVPHKHAWEEVYLIIEGKGLMMLEDSTKEVKAGDSIVILPNEWHNIKNLDEKEDLRLTVVCAPYWRPEGLVFDRNAPNKPVDG